MKTIGIIGAMPSELADIRSALPNSQVVTKAAFDYHINTISDALQIVHVCCGIGKVNAAICSQTLIDTFAPAAILNTGVAGGMDTAVKVCDIVISDTVTPHDVELRFLEQYPPYCSNYAADPALMEKAAEICQEQGVQSHFGRIVSGEAFISDSAVKAEIQERLQPKAVDMESAAIGQCCYRNGVPFVSIRCISDNADDEGDMSFEQFEKIAAKRVADIVLELAKRN